MVDIKDVMDDLFGSETKIDLLTFFRNNPTLTSSPKEISEMVGRKQDQVERALTDFIEMGLLNEKWSGTTRTISFNREKDQEIKKLIAEHIKKQRKEMFVKLFLSGTTKGSINQ